MGELAKTLVSLSGPDAVHGIIPEALVRYERDQHYTSTSRSPSTPRSKRASGTSTPVSATSAAGAAAESGPGTGAGTGGGSAKAADKPQSPVPAAVAKLRQEVLSEQQSAAADSDDTYELRVPDEKIFGRTTVVKDMHTRKQMMAREVIDGGPGSGFIALSGGYGTLEELLETCTWNQLGIHNKGICLYNVDGFFDGILAWIRKAVDEGFIKGQNDRIIVQATDAEGAIRALREYKVSNSVLKLSWGNE